MGLIEAYRYKASITQSETQLTKHVVDSIHQVTPHLFRIDLMDSQPQVAQRCTYVNMSSDSKSGRDLMLKVFHEGRRVVAIEVVIPNDDELECILSGS
ncbi:MAG: hypothetical protein EOP06_19025 [Proteobacteria bacterium]|nr:MAG: hypothetical protein EOP06_19025 [Pseudomonadota bacterium]